MGFCDCRKYCAIGALLRAQWNKWIQWFVNSLCIVMELSVLMSVKLLTKELLFNT